MALITFGVKNKPIDFGEYFVKCPSCETDSLADIMVSTYYFHIFFVPVIPTEKDALVICQKCGLKRSGISFDEKLISNYNEIKSNYRHPWYTYIGITIVLFVLLSIIIGRLF